MFFSRSTSWPIYERAERAWTCLDLGPSERPRGPEIGSAHRGVACGTEDSHEGCQVAWSCAAPWPSVGVLWMICSGPYHFWRAPCRRRAPVPKALNCLGLLYELGASSQGLGPRCWRGSVSVSEGRHLGHSTSRCTAARTCPGAATFGILDRLLDLLQAP